MSKKNQRERQGKVYEPAFANLNEKLFIPSSKTGCSWRNSRPCPVWGSPGSSSPTQNTATTQHADNISCSLSALYLKNNKHFGISRGGPAVQLELSLHFIPASSYYADLDKETVLLYFSKSHKQIRTYFLFSCCLYKVKIYATALKCEFNMLKWIFGLFKYKYNIFIFVIRKVGWAIAAVDKSQLSPCTQHRTFLLFITLKTRIGSTVMLVHLSL